MANKTTWKQGQSGNPSGRPPKSRALTDLLIAAGKTRVQSEDGQLIPRNKLLADMIWTAIVAGQIQFLAANRGFDERGLKARDRVSRVEARDWFEIVKWLYAQIDGDLSVHIEDSPEGDDALAGATDSNAVVILPDNGRSVQRPASEEGQKQESEEETSQAIEPESSPQ